jgi:hypothetical protein
MGLYRSNRQDHRPPQYAAAGEFHQGRGSVKVGDKFGFIDATGKVVIPPQFDRVENFAGDPARVKIGEKWGFVDPNGNMVIPPQSFGSLR